MTTDGIHTAHARIRAEHLPLHDNAGDFYFRGRSGHRTSMKCLNVYPYLFHCGLWRGRSTWTQGRIPDVHGCGRRESCRPVRDA